MIKAFLYHCEYNNQLRCCSQLAEKNSPNNFPSFVETRGTGETGEIVKIINQTAG